jgi:hypothetical protein
MFSLNRMDSSTGAVAGYVSLALVVAREVFHLINHSRVRSRCCGAVLDASIDVGNSSPDSSTPLKVTPPPPQEKNELPV